jgi:hypothetical protein
MTCASAGDVVVVVSNFGASPLGITEVRIKTRTGGGADNVGPPTQPRKGNPLPNLPGRLGTSSDGWLHYEVGTRAIPFPGGSARFGKPLLFPSDAEVVNISVWCSYEVKVGVFSSVILRLAHVGVGEDDFRRGVRNHLVRRSLALPPSSAR